MVAGLRPAPALLAQSFRISVYIIRQSMLNLIHTTMAQKKRDSESFNVATAIGPQQVIVVDFKFASHLATAMSDIIYRGDHTAAREFLEMLVSSLENQTTPQTDEE